MLETTLIATAERALRMQRDLHRDPAVARQAILTARPTTTPGAPPGARPDRSRAAPLRLLLRLRLRML